LQRSVLNGVLLGGGIEHRRIDARTTIDRGNDAAGAATIKSAGSAGARGCPPRPCHATRTAGVDDHGAAKASRSIRKRPASAGLAARRAAKTRRHAAGATRSYRRGIAAASAGVSLSI
jgi:hypothetical protein